MKLPPKEDIFLQSIENDFNFFNEYYKNNYKKSEEEFRKYINNLSKDCKLFNYSYKSYFKDLLDLSKKYYDTLNKNDIDRMNNIFKDIITNKLYLYGNKFLIGCFLDGDKYSLLDKLKIKFYISEDDINKKNQSLLSVETSNNDCILLSIVELTDHTVIENKKIKNITLYVLGNPFKITNGQIYSFLNKLYDNLNLYSGKQYYLSYSIKLFNDLLGSIDWSISSDEINKKINNSLITTWLFDYGYKKEIIISLEEIIRIKNKLYKDMGCKYYLALDAESLEIKDSFPKICRVYVPK